MKVKVLYIQPNGALNGSAISLLNILLKLDKNKYEPLVVTSALGPYNELLTSKNIRNTVVSFIPYVATPAPAMFSSDYISNFNTLFRKINFNEIVSSFEPDIIHVNDEAALPFMLQYKFKTKVVWHLRGVIRGDFLSNQHLVSRTFIKKKSNHIITISEDESYGFENFKNLSIINNSIDTYESDKYIEKGSSFRAEFNIKEDVIAIGMIGKLARHKGAWNFLEATSILINKAQNLNVKFFLVAEIPASKINNWGIRGKLGLIEKIHPFDKAQKLVQKYKISDKVIFTGRRNDVLNIMRGLDIVVACFDMDAIGRPAFEAMSVGRPPIVNSGYTGKSSIVKHMKNGIIVPRENPEKLAEAMKLLAENKELRENLGKNGYVDARESFDSSKNIKKIEAIYEKLILTN